MYQCIMNMAQFKVEPVQKLLNEEEHLKQLAAELWLKGEISDTKLKKILNTEDIRDLKFGKRWIEETINIIN